MGGIHNGVLASGGTPPSLRVISMAVAYTLYAPFLGGGTTLVLAHACARVGRRAAQLQRDVDCEPDGTMKLGGALPGTSTSCAHSLQAETTLMIQSGYRQQGVGISG